MERKNPQSDSVLSGEIYFPGNQFISYYLLVSKGMGVRNEQVSEYVPFWAAREVIMTIFLLQATHPKAFFAPVNNLKS
jgi:hypothetical protein